MLSTIIANSGLSATEERNILSIYDDDELNAACLAERLENLQDEIAKKICEAHGVSKLYGPLFKFEKVKEILKDFGFKYAWADEKEESHFFFNHETGDEIDLYPTIWYPKQGEMHIQNIFVH
jgi:hypothetical protein